LGFLDEHRTTSEELIVPFGDRRVRFSVGSNLNKGKPTRTVGLAVTGDAHALDRSAPLRKGVPQLLLSNGVGQVSHKQLGAHLLLLFCLGEARKLGRSHSRGNRKNLPNARAIKAHK
jgi:hypothetical protein